MTAREQMAKTFYQIAMAGADREGLPMAQLVPDWETLHPEVQEPYLKMADEALPQIYRAMADRKAGRLLPWEEAKKALGIQ